jgi:hypothetical protein
LNRKIRPVKHPLATNCSPSPPSLFFLDLWQTKIICKLHDVYVCVVVTN